MPTAPAGSPEIPRPLADLTGRISAPADGEWKIATVLFADIASSTALIGGLDAEEARRILKPAVDTMVEIVHRYEGVTRAEGDGIMASFGAPVALEDHAIRACCAALDLQKAMPRHVADVRNEFGLLFEVRVGINSGPVVATVSHKDGGPVEFRVDGMPTHIAKRLESITPPGKILLTCHTKTLVEGFVVAAAAGTISLRDVPDRLDVYELQSINSRLQFPARASRGVSTFVDRDDEIERLRRAASLALSGQGQGVGLVGDAGIGKSRIFQEFSLSIQREGWLVLETGSVSYGKASSYRPLIDLLGCYFEIQSRDDERQVRENVAKKLLSLGDQKLLEQMPFLVGAFGVRINDDIWMDCSPSERQRELFEALKRILIREAQDHPACVIFEDLHWVDDETQTFIEMLLEGIHAAKVLLLVNHRPEYQNRWAAKGSFSQIRIDPLPAARANELLEALLGVHEGLSPIKHTLIEAAQGNPLFLEESVRSLIENDLLDKTSGQWRAVGSVPADFVPHTIDALLAARIDRLPSHLKEILQCAAVIGNDVPRALLEVVTGLTPLGLVGGIEALIAKEFLYEKALFPEVQYAFKHSMTREVTYASLLRERRAALHARAAHALERLAVGRVEEHVERLAEHTERGGIWDKALDYLQRAGAKMYFLYANSEAVSYFERALKVIRRLPETRATLEQTVDLHFELRNALLPLGHLDRVINSLRQVEPALAVLNDKPRSARYAAFRCNYHFLAGEQREAIEFAEAGLLLARACGDRFVEGELLYRLGQSYGALGEFRRAIAILEKSVAFTTDERARSHFDLSVIPPVVSRIWLVNALIEVGDFASGMRNAKEALEIAERAEHPLSQVLGWLSIGQVLARKNELEGAIGALERGLNLSEKWLLRVWRPRLASVLGVTYARKGRVKDGVQLARQAVSDAEQMQMKVDRAGLLVRLGQASLIAGQLDEALTLGEQAIEIAAAQDAKGDEAWARFLLARTYWATHPRNLDESTEQLGIALRLALTCEARPLAAYCKQTFAEIYALRGEEATAANFRADASSSYGELGIAPLPIDPVRAESS